MSIRRIILRYKWKFLITLSMVLLDAGLLILFPLFIGYAIEDALTKDYQGAMLLAGLGLLTLLVGAGRRFFDSRFYAKVYQDLGEDAGKQENADTSTKAARLGFLGEVVEFFESSVPEIINNVIGLVGTLIIIATIDQKIFLGCLGILAIVSIVYGLTEKKTIRYNASYNSELEKQVTVLEENRPVMLRGHLKKLMRWNIKLSDLETLNFSAIWFFMMIFLVFSLISSVSEGVVGYGAIFSLVLYLFQFIESIAIMPLFYQQWLRLNEIMGRLKSPGPEIVETARA